MKIKSLNLLLNVAVLLMALSLIGCTESGDNTPQPKSTAFDFSGNTAEHRSIKLNILPKDKEQEYIVFLSEKKHFTVNGIDTRDELLEDDYAYFSMLAEREGMGVRDLLTYAGWLVKGDKIGYGAINLNPDTEYVVYCYGVEFEGDFYEATTEICYTEIKTTAPKSISVDFAVEVAVVDNVSTISIDPKEYNGYYYSFIVPETDEYYLYDGMEFSNDYLAHYRNTLLKEFDKEIALGSSVSELCHKGKVEFDTRLEPNKEYVVLVFALSDDKTPIISSLPTIERFTTQNFSTSDLTIDIAVTDITPYDAYLTVTPSNNNEQYACVLLGKNQVPTAESEYELMLAIMETFEPAILRGVHREKIFPFMPKSDYVILAFGVENNLPSTKLFRHDFTTTDADAGKISIESIELIKLFDVAEIVALDSSYAGKFGDSLCVAVVEAKTTAPTDKIYFWWYEDWMKIELSEEAFLEDLLMYDPASSRTLMDMPYCIFEGEEPFSIFFAGIAEDEDGNLSPIYYGEPFQTSKDMCSPAEEFFDYVGTRSTDHHLVMMR